MEAGWRPSWYAGGWTSGKETGRKSPVGDQERGSGQGQDSGAASASTEGSKEGTTMVAGGHAGKKKIKAADWSTEKRVSVRRENIRELQKMKEGQLA